MSEISFSVPSPNGDIEIKIPPCESLFILGRNGTGKSALVHYIQNQCRNFYSDRIVYIPGSRTCYFEGESLNMTQNSRATFEKNKLVYDASPNIRIRPISGTNRTEQAIFDLQAKEVQYRIQASNEIEKDGSDSPAIARLQSKSSPLNSVNRLLQQSNLPIQTVMQDGELKAVRDGNVYSISKMSDGERTALIIISEIISAKPTSIFLIDEPELHLHRAIILPLLSSIIAERPDCNMIISTHELALANDHPKSPIILVRGCVWNGESPSAWTVDCISNSESIPENLRIDLLGSRQTILFTEGTSTSRDQPLYAILFPKVSLRYRSSCTDVRRAVVGLRETETFHHARAFGLVDNDGMTELFRNKLLSEGVHALPVFAVESLYYAPEVISLVAERQGKTLDENPASLICAAREKALSTLRQPGKIEHLAARIAERQMRDKLLEKMPSRDAMKMCGDANLTISFPSPYPAAIARIQALLQANDLDAIVAGFPVRESGILGDIAQGLRFIGDADYEKAVRTTISATPSLAERLKAKLGGLATELE